MRARRLTPVIDVTTKLKVHDRFVSVGEVESIADPSYIDGAIVLTIDGRKIIDEEQWDLVDQLWCYFVHLIDDVYSNGSGEFYFPDQPLPVRCVTVDESYGARVVLSVGDKSSPVTSLIDIRDAFCAEANRVLHILQDACPENKAAYQTTISQIERLLSI